MKKHLSAFIFICLTFAALQAYGQNWPHNMTNGIGCDTCHFVYGTEPALLPPWTAHDPQDIDDTQFNTLCWSCHNDIDAPFVNTHSSLQIDNSYGDWSIECRVCHNAHGHEQIRAYGSESYLYEGISTNVTVTTLTQAGAGWAVDQWKGLPVFPNVLDLTLSYKILSNTADTLTVQGPMILSAVTAGDTFAIVYSKLIRSTLPTPNSGIKDVKFFDYMGPNSFADGDMVYDGICEVCHTMTNHHRNDGSGPAQSHNDGTDCVSCHVHLDGFGASGAIPVAPHNTPEFIANCDYCHVSTTDFTTPVPDSKCDQCHTPTGGLKPGFPSAPDVITHQGTACVGCHDPMFGSTNQKLVRTDLSSVGGAAAVVFPPYITGPTTYNGVCETCHTMTNHHRNDGSAPQQSHNDTSTCSVCHPHADAFSPSVVPPPPPHDTFDCTVCHIDADTSVPIRNEECLACHDGSQATAVVSHFDTQLCVECHNPMSVQTNFRGNTNLAFIRSTVLGTNIAFEARTGPYSFADDTNTPADMLAENYICNTCHTQTNHHRGDGSAPPGGQSHFDGQDCTQCHTHLGAFRDQETIANVPPPHNVFACDVCHVTDDTYVPNAQIPNSACLSCHDGSQATAVVSHFDTQLCVECHNPMSVQTNFRGNTNLAFIRSMVQGTNIAFEARTGPYSFADDSNTPADMLAENYICNTCHTATNHHRGDGSTPPGGQSHFDGQDCTQCHTHLGAFRDQETIANVPPPHNVFACDVCHVSDDTYVPNAQIPNSACLSCHDGSQATAVVSHFDTQLCVECHNPMSVQTNFRGNTNLAFIRSMVQGTNIAFEARTGPYSFADDTNTPADMLAENYICNTCHTATNHHRGDGSTPPGGQSHFDGQDCTQCHTHLGAFRDQETIANVPPPHNVFACDVCHVSDDTYVPNAPIPNSACQGCHGETAPGTGAGGSDLKVDRHYSPKYGMDSNCVDCHNPMSVQGSNAVFIRTTLASFNGSDYIHGSPNYDGICETCHTQTNHHQNDGNAPGGQSHNDGEVCTTCHEHINGFIPSGECVQCHDGVPAGATYVTRDVVGNDFTRASRHVFGGTVTNWDCIVCHREGDENAAAGGEVALTALHNNGGVPVVDMRDVDTVTSGWVWDKNNTSDGMFSDMDSFCLGCHDADGASGINVNTTDDGVNLSNARALTPFNSTDDVSEGIGGGTVNMTGYERQAVLDVATQFDPTNPSHHAVIDQAYQSHNANWGDGAWIDRTLKDGTRLITDNIYEAANLHCADCHTVDSADGGAHGGANGFMLQASSIDGTCFICHNSNVYFDPNRDFRGISRWDHDQEGSVWDPADGAVLGQYGANEGSTCLNCHGGDPAVDGFGGIHGLQAGADWRSGEPRYRFQGGSYMSHQPSSWTGTSGVTPTCYFSPTSDTQDWSNCTQHGGPGQETEDGRTSPPNYSRGVPGDY